DVAERGGRPKGPDAGWTAGPAEGRADVGTLAGLQEHDADDGETHEHVKHGERDDHHSPLDAAPRAAFLTMAMNPGPVRLAPPTRAPSISVSASSSSALSALTLPP